MLDEVTKTLKSGPVADSFCTAFTVPAAGFCVEIESLGPVSGIISEAIAKRLIKEGRLASFGWRDQTVVDTRVRNVWEIPGRNISVSVQGDDQFWRPILEKVQKNLGLAESGELKAELHNLLIYEPDQFFSAHQDSEKCDGMVATMTILLPSAFQGGALVIDHQGDKKSFGPPKNADDELNVIAFYADCHHEVKKVTAGYRIALTYNLRLGAKGTAFPGRKNTKLTSQIKRYFDAKAENFKKDVAFIFQAA